jgi:hypothetical protein
MRHELPAPLIHEKPSPEFNVAESTPNKVIEVIYIRKKLVAAL